MPPQMSVKGFALVARLRADVRISEIGLSVRGLITIMLKPSRPPHRPTMRSRESNAMVAHSRTPYDADFTFRLLPSGPLTW